MSKFAPHKWEYDSLQRVCDGDEPVAFVYEGKYTRLIAAAPELYWMVYNLLYELKRGNGARAEYVKQVIPQMEDLLNRIYGTVEELKPCPECGGIASLVENRRGWYVKCSQCGMCLGDEFKEDATGCFECFDSMGWAIAAWNAEAEQECNDEGQELKPCPFCGGTPYVISDKKNHTAVVKCPLCGVRMGTGGSSHETERPCSEFF